MKDTLGVIPPTPGLRQRSRRPSAALWLCAALVLSSSLYGTEAHADISNFDIAGNIFTKWLYRNNDSEGVLTYGNPFWPENYSGDNGVASEVELKITGQVSEFVEADVRLKSRFGSTWQDFFENGNVRYEDPNNSGESYGLDRAEYVKLRGYRVLIRKPYEFIDQISIGSSDLAMFNPWSIGKIRFIDRDNAKGVFLNGEASESVSWLAGAIALPKLWGGPGWTTGLGDDALESPLIAKDWAYGARLDFDFDDYKLVLVGTTTLDYEIDRADPDAQGALHPQCEDALGDPISGCTLDNTVDLDERYSNTIATAEIDIEAIDDVLINLFGAFATSQVDENYVANGVAENAGVFPMPYKDTQDFAARARAEIFEPFGLEDLSIRLEYFNIGEDYVSHFAARREADVLLTDGFIEGGQLPTLNIANEFQDFDEPFYESIIGWHGGTVLLEQDFDLLNLKVEQTAITYNTNQQGRDVETAYPDFLHTDGFTDTVLYDYANVGDRGRDPRSVYRENQDRFSLITVVQSTLDLDSLLDSKLNLKLKYIRDTDARDTGRSDDDYDGSIYTARLGWTVPIGVKLQSTLGGQYDLWEEANRSGNPSAGYRDYTTKRAIGFLKLRWSYGGVQFNYIFEAIHKDQEREANKGQLFEVLRSKATLSVAW